MQALQAIPDSQRTDAEWDELNELEIMFAPGNRVGAPDRSNAGGERNGGGQSRRKGGGGQRPQGGGNVAQPGATPQGGEQGAGGKRPARKFRKKPRNKDKAPAA
jgi:hypothetical protein